MRERSFGLAALPDGRASHTIYVLTPTSSHDLKYSSRARKPGLLELAMRTTGAARSLRLCRDLANLFQSGAAVSVLQQGAFFTPPALRPRVVLRFVSDGKNLLVSAMLAGGSEMANAPAVADAPAGQGHVVLFANNPRRHQTQGKLLSAFQCCA